MKYIEKGIEIERGNVKNDDKDDASPLAKCGLLLFGHFMSHAKGSYSLIPFGNLVVDLLPS